MYVRRPDTRRHGHVLAIPLHGRPHAFSRLYIPIQADRGYCRTSTRQSYQLVLLVAGIESANVEVTLVIVPAIVELGIDGAVIDRWASLSPLKDRNITIVLVVRIRVIADVCYS